MKEVEKEFERKGNLLLSSPPPRRAIGRIAAWGRHLGRPTQKGNLVMRKNLASMLAVAGGLAVATAACSAPAEEAPAEEAAVEETAAEGCCAAAEEEEAAE